MASPVEPFEYQHGPKEAAPDLNRAYEYEEAKNLGKQYKWVAEEDAADVADELTARRQADADLREDLAPLLEVPADYLPGFPGGSALELVQFVYAAIGTPTPAVAQVIISLGQSNGLGKADGANLDAAPLAAYSLRAAFPNIQQWNPKLQVPAFQDLLHGTNDLTASDATDCGGTPPGGGSPYGSDLFGHDPGLADRLAEVRPGVTYYRVKKSADGQEVGALVGSGGWKASLYARLAGAKAALEGLGKTWKCALLDLDFGETNSLNGTPIGPQLDQLLSELTEGGYIDADTITVLVGLKSTASLPGSGATTRAQMVAWAAVAPSTRKLTDPADYQGKSGDLLHLDGVTQMQIGHSDIPNAWLGLSGGFRIVADEPEEPGAGLSAPATASFLTAPGTYDADVFTPQAGVEFLYDGSGAYGTIGGKGSYRQNSPGDPVTYVDIHVTNTAFFSLDALESALGGDVELVLGSTVLATNSTLAGSTGPKRVFSRVALPSLGNHTLRYRQKASNPGTLWTLAQVQGETA